MPRQPLSPSPLRHSQYGVDPGHVKKRAAELPDMTGVLVEDLFTRMPPVIYPSQAGIVAVREAAERALERVDMSMIRPGDSVNILASHHGFTMAGGHPYAEVLRTVRRVVQERTGASNIFLRAGVGMRFRETEEYIKEFGLDDAYEGKASGMAPVDEGIPIETEIGTLYGLRKAYDADWIVHVHNSDVREVHFHRQTDRAVKPFAMSYARNETRSTYHQNMGPRAANFVARAIFNSPFVQEKFAFTVFQIMSPQGVVDVIADRDLYAVDEHVNVCGMKYYGKMITLLGEIDECIAVLDFPCPVPYVFAAGVIYANFVGANCDLFNLDLSLPSYTWYTEAFYGKEGRALHPSIPPVNPAIKMVVHNYAWGGYPSAFFARHTPTVVVSQEQAEVFRRDPLNYHYLEHALVAGDLEGAMAFAKRVANTDKVIVFDGAVGGVNVSEALADLLCQRSPAVEARVEEELLPRWLEQRSIDAAILANIR